MDRLRDSPIHYETTGYEVALERLCLMSLSEGMVTTDASKILISLSPVLFNFICFQILDYSGPCTGSGAPERELEKCRNVIGAWAMGALTFTYPPETGLAIGRSQNKCLGPGPWERALIFTHPKSSGLEIGKSLDIRLGPRPWG